MYLLWNAPRLVDTVGFVTADLGRLALGGRVQVYRIKVLCFGDSWLESCLSEGSIHKARECHPRSYRSRPCFLRHQRFVNGPIKGPDGDISYPATSLGRHEGARRRGNKKFKAKKRGRSKPSCISQLAAAAWNISHPLAESPAGGMVPCN